MEPSELHPTTKRFHGMDGLRRRQAHKTAVSDESVGFPRHTPPRAGPRHPRALLSVRESTDRALSQLILRTGLAVSAQTPAEERGRFSTLERLLVSRPSQGERTAGNRDPPWVPLTADRLSIISPLGALSLFALFTRRGCGRTSGRCLRPRLCLLLRLVLCLLNF